MHRIGERRAADGSYGRQKCPLCARQKLEYELARHLLRAHAGQLADMPAADFRLTGGRGPRVAG